MLQQNLLIVTILSLISLSFSVGGFHPIPINPEDKYQSYAIQLAHQFIKDEKESEVLVNTLFCDLQLVNGYKYRLYSIVRGIQGVEMISTIVFTGSFQGNVKTLSDFKILSHHKVELARVKLTSEKFEKIKQIVEDETHEKNFKSLEIRKYDSKYIIFLKIHDIKEIPSLVVISDVNKSEMVLELYEN